MRRWAPWIALVLVAVGGLAFGLHRSSSHPTINQEVLQIAGEVRCPVCNGETAAQSQAAASVQIRAQILRELQSGETKDQILDGLVQAYGTGILEKPQPTGVGLVVWVVPVVAILVAAGVLGLAFARWRAKAAADGSDSSAAIDTLPATGAGRDGTGCPRGFGAGEHGAAGRAAVVCSGRGETGSDQSSDQWNRWRQGRGTARHRHRMRPWPLGSWAQRGGSPGNPIRPR